MRDIAQIVLHSFGVFLLLGSVFSIVVGIALIVRHGRVIPAFARMNRWVSTRRALKSMEIPRPSEGQLLAGKRRLVAGLIFALCGAYAAYALVFVDPGRVVTALGVRGAPMTLASIAVETTRWALIAGCSAAAVAGIVLLFFPAAWRGIEASANRWYSTRRAMSGGDAMNVSVDRWVEAFPRASGAAIAALALVPGIAGVMLLNTRL